MDNNQQLKLLIASQIPAHRAFGPLRTLVFLDAQPCRNLDKTPCSTSSPAPSPPPPTTTMAPECAVSPLFAMRVLPRFMQPRPTCHTSQYGLPDEGLSRPSLQPYFYAINTFFRDHINKEPLALGPPPTDARRGHTMQQQPIADPHVRIPILLPIVQHMLQHAHRQYNALIWHLDNLVHNIFA
jgi:hypothetical protein